MELRNHHLGRISTPIGTTGDVQVDAGALIRRLLLFERCTVESIGLKEIPVLVDVFGYAGIRSLIESGALQFVMDAVTAGQVGQTDLEVTRRRGEPLPHGSYRIVTISIEDESREEQIHAALQEVHNSSLKFKEAVKLKGLLAPRLLRYPIDAARQGTSDTLADVLGHRESIWSAIRYVVRRDAGLDLGDIPNLESEDLGNDGDFRQPFSCPGPVRPSRVHISGVVT
jgi:hypothetical protein